MLYRVPHILTFQVAARRTTNKLQKKKSVMLQDHKVNINYNMSFFKNNIKCMLKRYCTRLHAVTGVLIVTP